VLAATSPRPRDPLLAPIPRRARLPESGGTQTPRRMRRHELPSPGLGLTLARLALWGFRLSGFLISALAGALRGRAGAREQGRRLRRALERLGGTAVKLGHQAAMRIDLMPFEVCDELARMPDRAPPLDVAYAMERLAAVTGKPVEETFEVLDPEPIVSDTISCVFQGQLRSGEKVALRVLRPGVARQISADLAAVGLLLRVLEVLTLLPQDLAARVEDELRAKLAEELDFVAAARYQTLFRRRTRQARLRFVSAARVYARLSGPDVMVSEFVAGVWLKEVLDAVASGDAAALASLEAKGVDPRKLARRLLELSWWSFFENPFFLGEPRAASLVVTAGGKLVFVRLGDCARATTATRELYREALIRLTQADVAGASDVLIRSLAPLPYIDVHDFESDVEEGLWQRFFAMVSRESPWPERTSAGPLLHLLNTARAAGVPVRLPIIRMIRSSILIEAIAFQLHPRMRLLAEFRRYLRGSDRRLVRRAHRDDAAVPPREAVARNVSLLADGLEQLRRMRFYGESMTRELPVEFLSLSDRGAFALALVLRLLVAVVASAVLLAATFVFQDGLEGHGVRLVDVVRETARSPVFLALVVVMVLYTIRRLLFRLAERDGD